MTAASSPTTSPLASGRVTSLDLARGAVMVLMAIDHVRVYSAIPPGGPEPGVFFTRWVTHFCAPVFFFLAGTGAFLHREKAGGPTGLTRFLVTRGALLVLLELTVIRVSWTFNFDFASYNLAGVIWALGWCLVLLGVLCRLPVGVVGAIGLAIVAGHNLFDGVAAGADDGAGGLARVLYLGGGFRIGPDGPPLVVLYSLIPWIGVMAAGYGFGAVVRLEPSRRRRLCFQIGGAAILAFLVLRGFDLYGDPRPWRAAAARGMPAPLAFLGATKYPASLSFLLMTLGPTIALLPVLEGARGRLARWLTVFGRAPLFYYLLHIPAIHLAAIAVSLARDGAVSPWLFANHPMMPPPAPEGYRWSLPLLYLVTALVVIALYFPCRWFADLKARRRDRWLSLL